MQSAFRTLVAVALLLTVAVVVGAEDKKEDKKEVEYKGDLGCAKCTFKLDKSIHGGNCTNAIRYKKDDKTEYVIILDKGKDEKYHKCSGIKEGATVKGVTSKKKETKDQLWITPNADGIKF